MRHEYYINHKEACNRQADQWHRKHRAKRLKYLREWYRRNRWAVLARQARRREEKRRYIQAAKQRPCADCGREYPPYVMDFDHVRGTKLKTLGNLRGSLHVLKREIDKCEVVCSNCHRERTAKRRGYNMTDMHPF